MDIEFDSGKNVANLMKHGIGFDKVVLFEWDTAHIERDDRANYGEARYIAHGFIDSRLHVLVFTLRDEAMRIISLRKSNLRETRKYYEEA